MRTRIWMFLLGLSVPAFSQQAAPAGTNRRVTVDVVVTDKSGSPQPGLTQSDFTLLDNKQPVSLVSFKAFEGSHAETPVEIVLLIDRINTTVENYANVREQLKKFLTRDGGKLPVPASMIFLSDTATNIQKTATRDGNALLTLLDQNDAGLRAVNRSQGFYGAVDRYQMSLAALKKIIDAEDQRPGRKLLIWLSPGWPMLSGPGVQLDLKGQQALFGDIVAVSTGLLHSQITLYSIDTIGVADAGGYRTDYYRSFLKGVTAPRQVEPADLSLQVIAAQSGGRVLNSSNDIARQVEECVDDTRAWYALSFDAPRAEGPNEYHKLEVKVGKKGLTARTRTGYYAQP